MVALASVCFIYCLSAFVCGEDRYRVIDVFLILVFIVALYFSYVSSNFSRSNDILLNLLVH